MRLHCECMCVWFAVGITFVFCVGTKKTKHKWSGLVVLHSKMRHEMTLQKEVFKTSLQSLSCHQFDGIKKNLDCEKCRSMCCVVKSLETVHSSFQVLWRHYLENIVMCFLEYRGNYELASELTEKKKKKKMWKGSYWMNESLVGR